jgi:predicted DNA-binding WGR domain protein
MEFPKWSLKFEESYGPSYDQDIWSGDSYCWETYFSGEVEEFKIWLIINRQEVIEAFNLSADKIKKLDTIVKNQTTGKLKKGYQEIRYFEFKDAHSNKFWEVSIAGSTVTARYGKIGTNGRTSVKELDSPEEAQEHARKQAAGKLKKGYQEIQKIAKG